MSATSLIPHTTRIRAASNIDFKTATTGVAAKAMRNEISRLVATVQDPLTKKVLITSEIRSSTSVDQSDPQAFDTEMQSFFFLFTRYLSERANNQDLYVIFS